MHQSENIKIKLITIINKDEYLAYQLDTAEEQANHYKNTTIQIYRKFHLQKLKIFR